MISERSQEYRVLGSMLQIYTPKETQRYISTVQSIKPSDVQEGMKELFSRKKEAKE